MIDHNIQSEIVISCLPGLGETLASEMQRLHFPVEEVRSRMVKTRGSLLDTYYLNLWLRTASHVHYKLKTFGAANPDELYDQAGKLPWEDYIEVDGYFSIQSVVHNEHIRDNRFANLRLKDAIADRFMKKFGKRPDSGPDAIGVGVYLYWEGNNATLYLDTSGRTLFKRGYRVRTVDAPMSEGLAAAVIYSTDWDGVSPFINPMCGSGTLAIEAALMACNIPPAWLREDFGFMGIKGFDEGHWSKVKKEAADSIRQEVPAIFYASDKKRSALQAAEMNAKKAGVYDLIHFEAIDFVRSEVPQAEAGVVVFNPEYGERMGESDKLKETYQRIGDFLKQKCVNYTGYVFTGNSDLAKSVGLKTSMRKPFYNAKIECRLLEYKMYTGTKKQNKETP